MNEQQDEKKGQEVLVSEWMKTARTFWESMFQGWMDQGPAFKPKDAGDASDAGRAQSSMYAAMKTFQALSTEMAEPGAVETVFKGAGAMPGILFKAAQAGLNGFLQYQQKWFERAGKIGKSAEAYKFEDLEENAFRAWAEIYEKEFRQFLNVPQLGLTRFYQERMMSVVDKLNIFQQRLSEFLRLLYLPVPRSLSVLQEKLAEIADAGSLPEDSKAYYQMWIKILEGHYMTLFQSPEYTATMSQTLDELCEFTLAKNTVMEDMLDSASVPKQKDIDDLYKEFYLLKKQFRALEKKVC